MTDATFATAVDFAAGGLMLAAVLIVWRRDLRAIARLLAWQGVALATIPIVRGAHDNDRALIVVGVAVLALRALVLPWLLARAVGAEPHAQREATPLVNTATSRLITAVLTVVAFAITRTSCTTPSKLSIVLASLARYEDGAPPKAGAVVWPITGSPRNVCAPRAFCGNDAYALSVPVVCACTTGTRNRVAVSTASPHWL